MRQPLFKLGTRPAALLAAMLVLACGSIRAAEDSAAKEQELIKVLQTGAKRKPKAGPRLRPPVVGTRRLISVSTGWRS